MSESSRESLPNVREWSGGPPASPEVVGRPSRMSLSLGGPSGCPAFVEMTPGHPGGHPGCSGVIETPSRMSGSGRESLPDVWLWSGGPSKWPGVVGGPSGCPAVVGRPSRLSGSGRKTLPDVWEPSQLSGIGWEAFPDVRQLSGGLRG